MIEDITSPKNDKLKFVTSLKNKKYRDKYNCFVVEGTRIVEEALASDWSVEQIVFSKSAFENNERIRNIINTAGKITDKMVSVSEALFERITDTEHPQGILAVVKIKKFSLVDLFCADNPFIVILDALQDPGNVGAILRTADAAGCSGIITTTGCADIFAPKTVRVTMGSIFHFPVITALSPDDIVLFANKHSVKLFVTSLSADSMFDCNFQNRCAVVFGNEGNGVSDVLLSSNATKFSIPMPGKAESLNVSAAAAIILFEVVRQRLS